MGNLLKIERLINSTGELEEIVKTMKNYANFNLNQFREASEGAEKYRENLNRALYIFLSEVEREREKPYVEEERERGKKSEEREKVLHILFGSDHGLVGKFNEKLVEFYRHELRKEEPIIFIIGEQLGNFFTEMEIDERFSVPQSVEAISTAVQDILYAIEKEREERGIKRVELFYTALEKNIPLQKRERLLPIDLEKIENQKKEWGSKVLPTYYSDGEVVLDNLLKHYLLITLYRAFCRSLMGENSSRLSAMESAEKNIGDKLEELDSVYKNLRQTQITEELLDVISGFQVVRRGKEISE